MRKYLSILLILLMFFLVVACGNTQDKKTYTIKFETFSNEKFDDVVIDTKKAITLPTPERTGFVFGGWYPNDEFVSGTEVTSETVIGKNITLYAKWNATKINITFDLDGGHFKDTTKSNVESIYTDEKITLERVYKEGYLFMGWYQGSEMITSETSFYESTTIKAQYKSMADLKASYSITLNLNGGHMYQLSDRFDGWGMMEDYSAEYQNMLNDFVGDVAQSMGRNRWELSWGGFYKNTQNILIGGDAFFGDDDNWNNWRFLMLFFYQFANETAKPYLYELAVNGYENSGVTYGAEQAAIRNEINGATDYDISINTVGSMTFTSADYSDPALCASIVDFLNINSYKTGEGAVLPIPIKEGHIFLGWYDNAELEGEPVYEILYNEYGNKTYYAKWQ